jgi:hypothetical protein
MPVPRFLLDTNAYDSLIDEPELVERLVHLRNQGKIEPFIETHVQIDELAEHPERYAQRRQLPAELFTTTVSTAGGIWGASKWGQSTWTGTTPTNSFVLGVSRLGCGKLSSGDAFEVLRGNTQRSNLNHARDVLLMDTARAHDAVFVTNETRLKKKDGAVGLRVWSWPMFRAYVRTIPE